MEKRPLRLVWVDLEMTGLDLETCVIVEIAVVITGADLVPLGELERVVWQPDEALARMDPFVREMHKTSGLDERIRASKTGIRDVERDVMTLVTEHCAFREGVLAGNSIHQDRRFLGRHMPVLEGFLHYRQVDVSSLKVLAQGWYGEKGAFAKEGKTHTALDDIRGSLEELRFYRRALFVAPLVRRVVHVVAELA